MLILFVEDVKVFSKVIFYLLGNVERIAYNRLVVLALCAFAIR